MLETFAVTDAAELAVLDRNGFVESRHAGSAVVLSPEGEPIASLGDPDALILPRSSMKPMQALGSLTAGASLAGVQLALSTASHAGTDRHVEVVREMLAAGGLTPDDLECPPAWPSDADTRDEMVRRHEDRSRLRMNCSGKHAAMLLACKASGWETAGYTDPAHPLQVHIRETVERFTGEKVQATAIDGCGAPVYAMTLRGLAHAIHRIGTASARSPFQLYRLAGELVQAVRDNPWTIDGPGRSDTIAIERLGVFAKGGAEGIMVMVAPNGTTVALKTLDGSLRVGTIVAAKLLANAGAITEAQFDDVSGALDLDVLGGGRPVGRIRPTV
ncbi:asparaginase [Microbacterium gorillae]|uniref:asparaginase n=1 Tax=Microbacterium gorillae TaxID=1231063 RepID=UPI00058EE30F|nr:asparaginase [Microbacterium gorillae]